jgi:nitroimidazol reductase NimA-like FMN-containing flavoprotein (pyridoxamine 5'-phosphate oxidase superfamily)
MHMKYHMRRADKAIQDEDDLKKILRTTEYVTIALSKDDEPYLVSLSHGYDEEKNCIYFHCASEGKKLDYMKVNDRTWGQAIQDHGYMQAECNHAYATVQFSGRTKFLEDLEEKHRAMVVMIRQLDSDPEKMIKGLKPESLGSTVIGRIDIDYMTGKKTEEVTI